VETPSTLSDSHVVSPPKSPLLSAKSPRHVKPSLYEWKLPQFLSSQWELPPCIVGESIQWELLMGADSSVNLYRKYSAQTLPLILFTLVALEILDVYLKENNNQRLCFIFFFPFCDLHTRPLLHVTIPWMSCVVCFREYVPCSVCTYSMLHFPCYLSCDQFYVMFHVSRVMCYLSYVMCYMILPTCAMRRLYYKSPMSIIT